MYPLTLIRKSVGCTNMVELVMLKYQIYLFIYIENIREFITIFMLNNNFLREFMLFSFFINIVRFEELTQDRNQSSEVRCAHVFFKNSQEFEDLHNPLLTAFKEYVISKSSATESSATECRPYLNSQNNIKYPAFKVKSKKKQLINQK